MVKEKENKIIRKVFLDDLPKKTKKGIQVSNRIDWKKSIGYKVKFIYDNIEDEIEIIDYKSQSQVLFIKYKNYDIFKIHLGNFLKCKFGNILNRKSNKFKYNIGDKFNNIIIIEKLYKKRNRRNGYIENQKYYKYHCNKCAYESWLEESKITEGRGCACCSNRVAVLGVNTIWDTDRWMCDLGVSEEDAKKYTKGSIRKIKVKCPNCKRQKTVMILDINHNHSIGCVCGDGFSYPEKIIFNILEQLNLEFITQLSKSTFQWCKNYKYDFYIPSLNCIIETHGLQHYSENGFVSYGGRTLREEKQNDATKKELALKNRIKYYVVIDCRKSELEWIKNNILHSNLVNLLDLHKINWEKCEEYALSNLVREVCKLKHDNPKITTTEISTIMKIHANTIIEYLKKGNKIGWCKYNAKDEIKKNALKNGGSNRISVEVQKNGKSFGLFKSISEVERKSEELFNTKLYSSNISICLKKNTKYKGFSFNYIQLNK